MLRAGDKAPDFNLPGVHGDISLSELCASGRVILLFFSEAGTPDCSRQLQPFVADYPGIRELGARVVAVSADSIARLASFEASLGIPFALASDSDLSVARRYGVDDQREGKSRRAAFVVAGDRRLIHANPDYVPANPSEYEAAVLSLGE